MNRVHIFPFEIDILGFFTKLINKKMVAILPPGKYFESKSTNINTIARKKTFELLFFKDIYATPNNTLKIKDLLHL